MFFKKEKTYTKEITGTIAEWFNVNTGKIVVVNYNEFLVVKAHSDYVELESNNVVVNVPYNVISLFKTKEV